MANTALEQALQQQIACLTELHSLLTEELAAIAGLNGDALKTLTPKKAAALNLLQQQDKHIHTLYQQQHTTHNEPQHSTDTPPYATLFEQARELLTQCKNQNQINAKAAHQSQLSAKQLKDILIGPPTSTTYGQSGAIQSSDSHLVKNLKA